MTRSTAAALLFAIPLFACGGENQLQGTDVGIADVSSSSAEQSCRGLKPAHCYCRLTIGDHTGNPGEALMTPAGEQGLALFTYTIPNKCYNQLADSIDYKLDKGCWLDCRNAFGVNGHPRDPGMSQLIAGASDTLRGLGFCGGVDLAPSWFAAGTNRYLNDTGSDFSLGVGGTVVTSGGKQTCQ